MIFKKIRNNFSLLIDSSRQVWIFEFAYKLVAFAVIFPIVLLTINSLMKIAGISYLTNEYIQRVITHPIVIIAIFIAICAFVFYCTYEMTYLSVCFETKRTSCNASIVDIFYNSYKVFRRVFKPKHIGLSIFYFISILASNVTVLFNILYSETNTNLIKMYVLRNHWYIKAAVILVFVIMYAVVIPGIYAMNICMMEGLGFREAYKKSARMVKKHPVGTISALVVYNLFILAIIGITYVLISVFLVAGVKLLNMAYLGNAIFLSALRTERFIIKCILVCVAIPLSFSAITHMYYRYTDIDDITFEFIDIQEGPARRRRIAYAVIMAAALVADACYLLISFNNNPFENVAIFHETKVMAHRGASTEAPENTMAAFQKAIDDMADYIELDVQLTNNGEVIVMHDSNAYRTTGVDANIVNMTYKEVKTLDAGSWFSDEYVGENVPSLKEVLELTQGKIKLNIELKPADNGTALAKNTVRLIEKYNMVNDCVITSFSESALKAVKTYNQEIKVGYILSAAYGDFYDMKNVDFFSVNAAFLSKRTIDAIHNSGKQVYAWTVNNKEAIKNLTNKGVDGIITDNPVLARETIYSRDTSETIINMIRYVFNQ
ncbi:MAG: glycerophosphoryl diester phosphodiesterase membrane domain-containing protein [Eubacterium sp.]|nr:glycerophosphoryl diester phosphodiesterase membrane domain-containing protein [Eubacterium sp.]